MQTQPNTINILLFDGPGSAQGTSSGCAKFLKRRSTASPWQSSVPELSGFMPIESVLLPKESRKSLSSEERRGQCVGGDPFLPPRKLPQQTLWPRASQTQQRTVSDRRGRGWSPHGPATGRRPERGRWLRPPVRGGGY